MRSYARVLLVVATALLMASFNCNNLVHKPAPAPGSWLVLLCKASDAPAEPHPTSYYLTLFDKTQHDLLFDYFDQTSNHTLDLSATEVYGWFPMTVTTSQISPAVRNNSQPVTRTQTAKDCIASSLGGMAAQGFTLDPSNYGGVLTIINVPVDAGDTGEKSVVSSGEPDISFYEHEMIHTYGQENHSWRISADTSADHIWDHGGDIEYNDCLDMMSYDTCVIMFQTSAYGGQGPELQSAYRQNLKWFPAGRSASLNSAGPATFSLVPLGDRSPGQTGTQVVNVPVPTRGAYLVEYHEPVGFDRGFNSGAVIIRELRPNSITYLITKADGSFIWKTGDMFTDAGNYLSIHVDDIVQGKATITINPNFSGGAVGVGAVCGDIYHGDVRSCPAGTQCQAKKTGEIQTIDYFCL